MYASVYDLKAFYGTRLGRVARRLIYRKIRTIWPDVSGLNMAGIGYAVPYLSDYRDEADRCIAVMPASLGVHHWPNSSKQNEDKNLVCLAEEPELPLETNSLDRILLVHSIEYAEMLKPNLQEIWRVLKSSGRLIIVVPNRVGLWSGSDSTPFGQGTPYTVGQIAYFLKDNYFMHEKTEHALFMPPFQASFMYQIAGAFEKTGGVVCPALSGVHVIEASKQVYAGIPNGAETMKAVVRGRKWFLPRPVQPYTKSIKHQ